MFPFHPHLSYIIYLLYFLIKLNSIFNITRDRISVIVQQYRTERYQLEELPNGLVSVISKINVYIQYHA
jgi:hypothetical protein